MESGRPLELLEGECSTYSKQMKEFQRGKILAFTQVLWQTIHNLMGKSPNTTLLQGGVINNIDEFCTNHKDDLVVLSYVKVCQSYLCAVFREDVLGADIAIEKGNSFKTINPANPTLLWDMFARGLCMFAMARTSKKERKKNYQKHAKKILKKFEHFVVKKGNPNCLHYKALFDAEHAALQKDRTDEASKSYHLALTLSARGGYVQDSAIINERYGEFLLHCLDNNEEASFYLQESVKLYSEWGALRKSNILRKKYRHLLCKCESICVCEMEQGLLIK